MYVLSLICISLTTNDVEHCYVLLGHLDIFFGEMSIRVLSSILKLDCVLAWVAKTKYHKLESLIHQHLFLMVWEAGKSNIKALAEPVSGKGLLPGSKIAIFSLHPLMVKGKASSLGTRIRKLIPITRPPSS